MIADSPSAGSDQGKIFASRGAVDSARRAEARIFRSSSSDD